LKMIPNEFTQGIKGKNKIRQKTLNP